MFTSNVENIYFYNLVCIPLAIRYTMFVYKPADSPHAQ